MLVIINIHLFVHSFIYCFSILFKILFCSPNLNSNKKKGNAVKDIKVYNLKIQLLFKCIHLNVINSCDLEFSLNDLPEITNLICWFGLQEICIILNSKNRLIILVEKNKTNITFSHRTGWWIESWKHLNLKQKLFCIIIMSLLSFW